LPTVTPEPEKSRRSYSGSGLSDYEAWARGRVAMATAEADPVRRQDHLWWAAAVAARPAAPVFHSVQTVNSWQFLCGADVYFVHKCGLADGIMGEQEGALEAEKQEVGNCRRDELES